MGLSYPQRLEWAILNTFDALGVPYDQPTTRDEVEAKVRGEGRDIDVGYGANGVVANVVRHRDGLLTAHDTVS